MVGSTKQNVGRWSLIALQHKREGGNEGGKRKGGRENRRRETATARKATDRRLQTVSVIQRLGERERKRGSQGDRQANRQTHRQTGQHPLSSTGQILQKRETDK